MVLRRYISRARARLALASLLVAAFAEAAAAPPPGDVGLVETVRVVGRLGARGPAKRRTQPASVEVHEAAEIRASGARSLPEFLALLPSVNAVDQTGNGRQLDVALRGFAGSDGSTAVLVDGVRLNEPDTNLASLELVRLEDVERVEITKGPRGAVLGGGSLGGVINVVTRRPVDARATSGSLSLGTFGHRDVSAVATRRVGAARFRASAGATRANGFRQDADLAETAGRLAVSRPWASGDVTFSWAHVDGRWRQPGALTAAETDSDPRQAPFNLLDHASNRHDVLSARIERAPQDGDTRWIAEASLRERRAETLTTGRLGGATAADPRYGFLTRDDVRTVAATFEGSTRCATKSASALTIEWGGEAARDRLSPRGFATDDISDGTVDALEEWSALHVAWDRAALFGGATWRLPRGWSVEASARRDVASVVRRGRELSFGTGRLEDVSGRRTFARTSLGLGLCRSGTVGGLDLDWRAAWQQSFQPPSATQLFAYPGFEGNEALAPQRGQGLTAGISVGGEAWALDVEAFATRVDDEIVYDGLARRNVNAAATLRRGLELGLRARMGRHATVRIDQVLTRATFLRGWDTGRGLVAAGNRVPLVPSSKTSLRVELLAPAGWTASASILVTGSSPLANDFDNSERPLPACGLVALHAGKPVPIRAGALALSLNVENALNRQHAARGIELPGGPYFNPAPPRTVSVGLDFRF